MTSEVISIEANRTLEAALQLPVTVKAELLPDSSGSVFLIADFPCPEVTRFVGDLKVYLKSDAAQTDLDYKLLRDLPIPDANTVGGLAMLLEKFPETQGVSYAHITDDVRASIIWPLWAVTYWQKIHEVRESANLWSKALAWLGEQQKSTTASVRAVANHVKEELVHLRWDGYINGSIQPANA